METPRIIRKEGDDVYRSYSMTVEEGQLPVLNGPFETFRRTEPDEYAETGCSYLSLETGETVLLVKISESV